MNMKLIGLALGVGMMSMAAEAQILTTLDEAGQAVGGNGFPGIPGTAGAPPGLSGADLAAFSGVGVSRNSGTRTGGITGIVDGIGFAGGSKTDTSTGTGNPIGAMGNGAGSPPPPVPEPGTYAMLTAGFGLVSVIYRKRRKAP